MRVRVARIGRPFGVAGEVTVQLFTDEPHRRLAVGATLWTAEDGGQSLTVYRLKGTGERTAVGFSGVADRTAAETLRGVELFATVAADESPQGADEWYDRQLLGLPCFDVAGERLGQVIGVEHPPAHDLLVVRPETGPVVRVPFVRSIVTDVAPDRVVMNPPGGLFDPRAVPDAD